MERVVKFEVISVEEFKRRVKVTDSVEVSVRR